MNFVRDGILIVDDKLQKCVVAVSMPDDYEKASSTIVTTVKDYVYNKTRPYDWETAFLDDVFNMDSFADEKVLIYIDTVCASKTECFMVVLDEFDKLTISLSGDYPVKKHFINIGGYGYQITSERDEMLPYNRIYYVLREQIYEEEVVEVSINVTKNK